MGEQTKQTLGARKQIPFLLLFLSFLFFSCEERQSLDRLVSLSNKQFGIPPTTKQVTPDVINIVVDISESMKGFAETGSLQEIIRKTVHALGPKADVKFYWFDTTYGKIEDFLSFFDRKMFSGPAANFQKAFSIRTTDTNEVLIIFTDLQFNNEVSYNNLVRIFQSEILNGRYIKLFSSNVDFSGRIFPQFVQRERFWYKGERPLYAICVGERSHSDFIERVLRKTIPWKNSVTLSSEVPIDWKIHQPSPTVRIMGKNLSMKSRDSLSFKLSLVSPVLNDWGDWSQDEIIVQTFTINDTFFVESNESLNIRNIQIKGDTCVVTFFSKDMNPTSTKLFRIFFRPNSVSPWISEQTCSPNGDQAKKTVKLKEFIEDVIRPVTNPFTVNTIHIILQKN